MLNIFMTIAICLCGTGAKQTPIDPNAEPYCFDWKEHGWNTPNEQEDPIALGVIARTNHNRQMRSMIFCLRHQAEETFPIEELQGINFSEGYEYE